MARDLSACQDATYCSSCFCEQVLPFGVHGSSGHFWRRLNTRLRVLALKRRENQSERKADGDNRINAAIFSTTSKWQQKKTITRF